MRISDWSSDGCSSDLAIVDVRRVLVEVVRRACVDGPAPGVVVHEIHPLQQGAGVFPALPPIPILVATNFTTCFRLWKTESNLSAQPGGHDAHKIGRA